MEASQINHDFYTSEYVAEILDQTKVIALVGASPRPERDSHKVMQFLLDNKYQVIPVNPRASGNLILGQLCVSSLAEITQSVDMVDIFLLIIGGVFLIIVTIVLWNMGLMNGLRRHGEFGLRLAMGESKGDVYRSMILESFIIGFTGTIFGTSIGLMLTYYVQEYGIDYSEVVSTMSTSSMVMPNIFYAQITPELYYIGFIPGVIATVLGTMLAGIAIYKREMAQLFKELEV